MTPEQMNDKNKALFGSIQVRSAAGAGQAIEEGADVNARGYRGTTPLHEAAGQPLIVRRLLERGADPNVADDLGRTPLHCAVGSPETSASDRREVLTELLNAKADPNARRTTGETPLHDAATIPRETATPVNQLLGAGAGPTARDELGNTPLHYAARHPAKGRALAVDHLLNAGATVNVQNHAGNTPLHMAIAGPGEEQAGTIARLLADRPDLSLRNSGGQTALELSVSLKNPVAQTIIERRLSALERHTERTTPMQPPKRFTVGTRVRSAVDLSGVPKGTEGIVDEDYKRGVMVAWDLPSQPLPPGYRAFDGRSAAASGILRDGFDKKRELHLLEVVERTRNQPHSRQQEVKTMATQNPTEKPAKNPAKPGSSKMRDYHERVANLIIEQIKKGVAPWQKPWKPGEKVLPENLSSGNRYNGGNSLHLAAVAQDRGYSDNRWGTLRQINRQGGRIRKGERGVSVLWVQHTQRVKTTDEKGKPVLDSEGKPAYREERLNPPRVKTYTVFNAEQADRLPARPAPAAKPAWKAHQQAENVLKASGVRIRNRRGDEASYNLGKDEIVLPKKSQFPSRSQYYQTALHEVGHATGHPDRMNRESLQKGVEAGFGSEAYAKEELRAEISAMMTGERIGVGHDPSRGAAYVENWVAVLKKDPLEIRHASGDAQKISDYVLRRGREREAERPAGTKEAPAAAKPPQQSREHPEPKRAAAAQSVAARAAAPSRVVQRAAGPSR